MNNNVTNLIGSKRFKLAQNANTNVQLQLENKNKPLNEYEFFADVDQYQVFLDERESSKKYRINGKFTLYTSNVLSPGSTIYAENKFTDLVWSPIFYGNPPLAPSNWVMQITYPSNSIHDYNISYTESSTRTINSEAYRGLQYKSLGVFNENDINYLTIKGVQNHNLIEGDYVSIYSKSNSINGIFQVKKIGINNQNLLKDLTLDFSIINPSAQLPSTSEGNFVKIVDVSFDDMNFTNPQDILPDLVATDISGSTLGSYGVGEIRYTKITTRLPHNLVINNFVDIRVGTGNQLNGNWRVYNIISPTEFIIKNNLYSGSQILAKGQSIQVGSLNNYAKFRILNGTPSEYYVRQFEVLTTNDYEVYPCAYSTNIYPDISDNTIGVANNVWLFQFNEDIDVERLSTNRNGPISDLYYTIIKRAGKNPPFPVGNDSWTTVSANWDFNYRTAGSSITPNLELISVYNPNGIGNIEKISGRTEYIDANGEIKAIPGSKYIGDFVEFNSLEITEKTASEIIHRFGLSSNPNGEGYYYKPFKNLSIRVYSNIIETALSGDTNLDIPGNYVTYSDGSIAWRDLLPIDFYEEDINGVNYPFLNGAHYFYFNYNLYVRRQYHN